MQKTYGLAIEKPHGLQALKLPPMTLANAEKARRKLETMGQSTLVVNLNAE